MNGFVFHIAAYCLLLLRVLKEHKGVLGVPISQSHLMTAYLLYRKVTSSNTSRLEAHASFFRLLMKGIFDPYVYFDRV